MLLIHIKSNLNNFCYYFSFKWLKKSNKYGFADPFIMFDKKSCVTKTSTMGYNKKAAEEATKLVKEFFTTTFKLQ